ncbi:hypothetical protein L195_g014141 [Trifolium pratense]|uniref:Uncharacterized protein n=1 Tax=Trifolium pratense TaxID=57577 RepID=A0A2K3PQ39_TRIPR|nr:hypothetical protein L195_g014141 [Trifolium pratense]
MRRRVAEFRRPIRRRLSYGICFLLGAFSVVVADAVTVAVVAVVEHAMRLLHVTT